MFSKNKLVAYFFILVNAIIGYFQRDNILNLFNAKYQLLEQRRYFDIKAYQLNALLAGQDPRFYSMAIYALLTFITSWAAIHFYFQQKKYSKITLAIYALAYTVAFLLLLSSTLVHQQNIGFELFQKIKNSLSSSFFLWFLMAMFVYDSKQKIESNA